MNYPQCLQYLDRLGDEILTMKFGLQTIERLLEELGNPHLRFPTVIVAGTNGKGSVAHFLHSILTSCGVRCGLYTSPHVVRVEERFRMREQTTEPETFARCLTRVVEAVETLPLASHPTYFEILTAAGFLFFAEQQAELVVLEVGMGGRLDSTNVTDPLVAILTSISYDHQGFLGHTLTEIALQKAGVMRPGRPALMAPQNPEVEAVLRREAASRGAPLHALETAALQTLEGKQGRYRFRFRDLECALQLYGEHQVENAALALQACDFLRQVGMPVSGACLQQGVEQTRLAGRIQKVAEAPAIFLDGAHNAAAAEKLAGFLERHTAAPRHLLFGIMRDKDIGGVLRILVPLFERIYFTAVRSRRAATLPQLRQLCPSGLALADPGQAFRQARQGCDTLVVAGSFYLVGDILQKGLAPGPDPASRGQAATARGVSS